MEMVLQLRATNQATVKDIVDLRKFMRSSMTRNQKQIDKVIEKMDEGALLIQEYLQALKRQTENRSSNHHHDDGTFRETSSFGARQRSASEPIRSKSSACKP